MKYTKPVVASADAVIQRTSCNTWTCPEKFNCSKGYTCVKFNCSKQYYT